MRHVLSRRTSQVAPGRCECRSVRSISKPHPRPSTAGTLGSDADGFTWLFNSVGESTLAAATLHGATNAWISWGLTDATPSESVVMFAWFVGLWVGVAAILVLVNGARTLTRSDRKIVSYVACRRRLNTEHLSPVENCAVPENLNG